MSDEPAPEEPTVEEPAPQTQGEGEGTQPPAEPMPDQVDPEDPTVFGAEPMPPADPNDPNTYPDENSPIGGGPLYRRTGP